MHPLWVGFSLKEEWQNDIRTTMGLAIHGYPNLFTAGAPLAPAAALCNMTTCLQQQTEWITNFVEFLEERNIDTVEPNSRFEEEWVQHHDETAEATLVTKTDSWYMGSNIEGKPSIEVDLIAEENVGNINPIFKIFAVFKYLIFGTSLDE